MPLMGQGNDSFVSRYANRFNLKIDNSWSLREQKLFVLQKILDGEIYDNLSPFYMEYAGGGNNGTYIQLAKRRPSVMYQLPKIIVDESVSLLFGEGHFPTVRCEHEETTSQFLQYITSKSNLKNALIEAAKMGSIGSVAIVVKVLNGCFYLDVLNTRSLTPVFDWQMPDVLLELREKKKFEGAALIAQGYNIKADDKKKMFYVERRWTVNEEIYYVPYLCEDADDNQEYKPTRDEERSTTHDLGFVPAVWIKNLPKSCAIDGDCTFLPVIDISIEIDYQLSQLGRLLKYNSDPTLVIKNPSTLEGSQLIKGLGALQLDERGDAYLLEITNGATKSVIDYVNLLRQLGLESVRGNRVNPDKISALHSGKALQMLNSSLIGLVSEMRLSYGDNGLLRVYQLMLDIYHTGTLDIDCGDVMPEANYDCSGHLYLDWPDWYPPTPDDRLNTAQTLTTLTAGNLISKETATTSLAEDYQISDIKQELSDIAQSQQEDYDRAMDSKKDNSKQSEAKKVEGL